MSKVSAWAVLDSRRYGGHSSWLTSLLEASVTARPKGNLLLRKLLPGSFSSLLGRGHNVEEGPGEGDVSRNQRPGCATGKTSWQRDHPTPPRPSLMPQVSGGEQTRRQNHLFKNGQAICKQKQAFLSMTHARGGGVAWKKAGWSRLSYSSGLSPHPARPRPSTSPTSALLPGPSGTHRPPSLEFSGSPGAQPSHTGGQVTNTPLLPPGN